MAEMKDIRRLARDIGRRSEPERVVLFGSHARGEASQDSDVDLLVVMPDEGRPVDRAVQIRQYIRPSFPVDILVRSPERVRQRIAMCDDFMRELMEKGVVLY